MTALADPAAVSTAERLAAAAALVARGDLDEAEAIARGIVDREPSNGAAMNLLGATAIARGDGAAALALLSATASSFPNRPEIVANLAVAHQMNGDHDAALAAAEHAAALAPHDPRPRLLVGQLRLELGDVAAARAAAAMLLDQGPDDPEALVFAAAVALACGDRSTAEAQLRRATAIAPTHAEAQINLAELLAARGERRAALAAAERAQLAAPTDLRTRLCHARRLAEAGDLDAAEVAVKRVLAVGPERIEPNELWSRIALARGDVEKAIASLAELVRRRAGDPPALLALARLLRDAGRTEQALAIADDLAARSAPLHGAEALRRAVQLSLGRFEAVWPTAASAAAQVITGIVAVGDGDPAESLIALAAAERLAEQRHARLPLHGGQALAALLPEGSRLDIAEAPVPGAVVATLATAAAFAGDAPWPIGTPRVEAAHAAAWAAALAGLPRPWIGISWSDGVGGPPLDALVEILDTAGTLVALATGETRRALAAHPGILDGGRHLADLPDLVAAVSVLDAVIAPDGALLSVAGALGRPAAAVLPPGHGWAWHAGANGPSTWFPSVTVLRQQRPGIDVAAWRGPLQGLHPFLATLAGARG